MTASSTTDAEVDAAAAVAVLLLKHPQLTRAVLAGVRVALDVSRLDLEREVTAALGDDDEPEHVQDEP